MITEDYVSFEVAKLLKEKGFDEEILAVYIYDNLFIKGENNIANPANIPIIPAPTNQMTMKWLREIHKLPINIWYDKEEDTPNDEVWTSEIAIGNPYTIVGSFASYEEACEAGIKYCLKNLI